MVLRDDQGDYTDDVPYTPGEGNGAGSYSNLFSDGMSATVGRMSIGLAGGGGSRAGGSLTRQDLDEVEGAAARMGANEYDYGGQEGDTDTDLSDVESVASFASEASGMEDGDEDYGSSASSKKAAKKKKAAAKRSWFTITLGPTDELEEDSEDDDDDQGGVGGGDVLSGSHRDDSHLPQLQSGPGFNWRGACFAAGLGEAAVEALEDSGANSLREVGFLSDADLTSLGLSHDDVGVVRQVVSAAAAADAANRPLTDWRLFMVAADLKQYVPVLEQRGVGSYHELSLISDQEYSKVTRTGMTKDEIARLRTVLAQADTIVGSAGSGAGKPPVLKAAVANSSSEQKQEQDLVGGFTQRLSFLGTFAEGLATTALQEVSGATGVDVSLPAGLGGAGNASPTSATATANTAPAGKSSGGSDVESTLRKLPPDQGAVLLNDLSLATQVKLLGTMPPSKGAAIISHMRLEPASRGAVLLRLPSRIRGLVIVELKPSLLAATMAGLEPSDVATLLGSLDATDGDRFKAFSLFHDGFAGQLLRALTATERADLMAGMRIKEQSRVLALMTPSERGMSLKALPMEVQVALLGAMTEADRREALAFVEPAVLAMMLVDMDGASREAALSHMTATEVSALLVAGMTALSKLELEVLDNLTIDQLSSRLHRLEDLAAETNAQIVKKKQRSGGGEDEDGEDDDNEGVEYARGEDGLPLLDPATGEPIKTKQPTAREKRLAQLWKGLRVDARHAAAASRDLCLTLQNKHLGAAAAEDLGTRAPPKDVLEQLTLAGRRSVALRALLAELPFMDDVSDTVGGGVHGNGGSGGDANNALLSSSLKQVSQEDLLRELGSRMGAGSEDPSLAVERLAVAAGYTKRGSATDVYSGSMASRAPGTDKDVRFSLRCEGLSSAGFGAEQQQALEKLLAKGYGLKGSGASSKSGSGDVKVSVVGFSTGGAFAGASSGGFQSGEDSEESCVVVDCRAVGFKTATAAGKFIAAARAAPVPMGSERAFGRVTFEKPPSLCSGGDGDFGGGSSGGGGVPTAPTVAAATAGDGEAKLLVVPPTLANQANAYDPTVLEIEVISNPGRLRGSAPVGEPVVVRGLANGTKYRFTAHARNATGWSPFSAPSHPLVPGDLTAPPLPPEISAVTTYDCDVELGVLVAPAGKYFLRSCTLVEVRSEPGGQTAFAPPGVPVLLQGLKPGVSYRFRARAKNMNGWSRASKPSAPVTLTQSWNGDDNTRVSSGDAKAQSSQSALSQDAPMGYEGEDLMEDDLVGAAKEALRDHNLEKDLLRKGKSPLEVLILKQRYKKGELAETDLVELGQSGPPSSAKKNGNNGERVFGNGGDTELTTEESVELELKQRAEGKKQRFSVKEEVNMSHDVFSRQMKDVEGLSAGDNKFLRRFVGLMAVKGIVCFKHGRSSRRKTLIKMDPQGTKVFWESKGKSPEDACIDLGREVKDVVKGQVYSWFRSVAMDTECCISVVCHAPSSGSQKAKRLDLECESRDDATLLFAALSVLATARKPDALKSQIEAEDVETDDA